MQCTGGIGLVLVLFPEVVSGKTKSFCVSNPFPLKIWCRAAQGKVTESYAYGKLALLYYAGCMLVLSVDITENQPSGFIWGVSRKKKKNLKLKFLWSAIICPERPLLALFPHSLQCHLFKTRIRGLNPVSWFDVQKLTTEFPSTVSSSVTRSFSSISVLFSPDLLPLFNQLIDVEAPVMPLNGTLLRNNQHQTHYLIVFPSSLKYKHSWEDRTCSYLYF